MKNSRKKANIIWRNLLTGEVECQSVFLKFKYDEICGIEYKEIMKEFKSQLEDITKDSDIRKYSIGYAEIETPKHVTYNYQYQNCNIWIDPTQLNISKK
ncbi:hypothetical protein ATCCB_0059 [Lactobacillus phage ATCCB]|nr:hypothetical protein ATCCB_0059 [Lactobacillus phage ATCCB]